MDRDIELFVDHPSLQYNEDEIIHMILGSIESIGEKFPKGDLSIALLGNKKLAQIHGDFLDDPTETDVITFPGDKEMEFAGEICVSVDRANECFSKHGTNFSNELTLYIVHGLLHLSGLKDKTEEESAEMRKGETNTMNFLHNKTLIPSFKI